MLPVSPNEPKDRTTGATDATEYIAELIARRIMHPSSVYMNGPFRDDAEKYKCLRHARDLVADIAQDGFVIAPAADVLRENQRAIDVDDLRALLKAAPLGMRPSREAEAFLNRIKAIADGGAK